MMETSAFGFGLAEFFLLVLGGQFLGLVPGERDPLLIKSPPAQAYVYAEWTAPGPGAANAPGLEGLVADPEIQTLIETIAAAVRNSEHGWPVFAPEVEFAASQEFRALALLAARHSGGFWFFEEFNGYWISALSWSLPQKNRMRVR